jgi:hypothetical protein
MLDKFPRSSHEHATTYKISRVTGTDTRLKPRNSAYSPWRKSVCFKKTTERYSSHRGEVVNSHWLERYFDSFFFARAERDQGVFKSAFNQMHFTCVELSDELLVERYEKFGGIPKFIFENPAIASFDALKIIKYVCKRW